jgi:dihydrodipicolinate synthase/N-acetylneuraminate lyase
MTIPLPNLRLPRAQFLQRIFPDGVPRLWCPPLTHYDAEGLINAGRIAAHLRNLARHVGGLLIPGSTGDGWELSEVERRELLEIGLAQANQLNLQVLIGNLHPDISETLRLIREDVEWLKSRFGENDLTTVLAKARVCGFTVCAPRGKQSTQEQIGQALTSVLELGLPTAIYQLPQVTLNEIGPELAADLAHRHQNFIFFKDTSGSDAVALSGKSLDSVFTARGAEGDYARWLKVSSGPYDGFLLASANCFAPELRQMIADLAGGRWDAGQRLAACITAAVGDIMKLTAALKDGNPFANANKAIDHFLAHGPKAVNEPPPRLHAGSFLPLGLIRSTGEILSREQLMPVKGYLG